ncbi:hypothetical protein HETIRDRAFT_314366, partial [Heterobasidion irregulare TC 32-1]
ITMSDLDEFTETVFQELRDGVPILGTDGPLDMTGVDCLPDMHNLEEHPRPYGHDWTGVDLLPAEGSNEEAELMRILEESGVCVNPSAPNQDYAYNQGFSAFTSNAASSGVVPAYDRYATAAPQALSQSMSPEIYCLWPAPHRVPFTQTSTDYFSVANESAPLPSIARRKRRLDDNGVEWSTSKHKRWLSASAGEQIPPSAHPVSSRFATAYEASEGNALRYNNETTRTFGGEEIFFAADAVPVTVPSSIQGPWPTMTSTAAPATHPYHPQAPYMSAGYNNQAIPHSFSSFGAQPTFQQDVPMLPWGATPESRQRFDMMPHIPTENGVYFPRPPFITGPSMIYDPSLQRMTSAEEEDPFLLRSMPTMPIESSLGASFAQPQPSYSTTMREPYRVLHTSAAEPQPFTFPVAAPIFGAVPYPPDGRLPSVANALQISGSSTSSMVPSAAKPKRKKQPPRASGTTSSSKIPSTSKPKKKKQPPRASGTTSKAPSTSKPKRKKQAPAQTSGSSSSTAPSCVRPIKRRRPPQTPYDPDGVGCHICKGGFTRPSEVTKHLRTKKHRLNELAMMFPGLKMSQPKKDIICPIDKCDEVAVESWLMKQHLEEIHGLIAKAVSATNVNNADVEKGDDVDTDEDESD